jgi:dolichol-phosphate mannosyltransferase
MKTLIVLPSYNERANILELIEAVLGIDPEFEVVVVDDSSPDGTGACVRAAAAERPSFRQRVCLIERAKKDGRGGAVRDGLAYGKRLGRFAAFVEMDCDFSHEPSAISQGLALLQAGNDVVIGARYPEGTIVGWPASRRAFSFLANLLARSLIDHKVADYTNGFRFYGARAVDILLEHEQRHKGYIYLSETLALLLKHDLRIAAFPIVFRNRERGISNTSLKEVRSALRGIFQIAWQYRVG